MGIKQIHLFLISASAVVSTVLAWWCFDKTILPMAVGAFLLAIGLTVYAIIFYKKNLA